MQELFNQEKINKVVLENNKRLAKEVEKIVRKSRYTNQEYITSYVKEVWQVERTQNRTTKKYLVSLVLPLRANQGKGALITLKVKLTDIEVDYITNKAGALLDGGRLKLKTRFSYGFKTDGFPFIRYDLLIGGKYSNTEFLDDMQVDVIMGNMQSIDTAYNIHLELTSSVETAVLDATGDNNITTSDVVDID